MKPSELFGVVIRSLGLLILVGVLHLLVAAMGSLFSRTPFLAAIVVGVPLLFLAIWFLTGAEGLVSIAYPEESEEDDQAD
jgi:hypothetical protein